MSSTGRPHFHFLSLAERACTGCGVAYLSRCISRAAGIPRWFDWVLMLALIAEGRGRVSR